MKALDYLKRFRQCSKLHNALSAVTEKAEALEWEPPNGIIIAANIEDPEDSIIFVKGTPYSIIQLVAVILRRFVNTYPEKKRTSIKEEIVEIVRKL